MLIRAFSLIILSLSLYACNDSQSYPGGVPLPADGTGTIDQGGETGGTSSIDLVFGLTGTPPTAAAAGGTLVLDYRLDNTGDTADGGIAIYGVLSHSSNADATQGSSYLLATVIAIDAGATVNGSLSLDLPSTLATGDYQLYVYAQSSQTEANEANNSQTHNFSVSGGSCSSDLYEEDDSPLAATDIILNNAQSHNLCFDTTDWVRIMATAGKTYGVTTLWSAGSGGPGVYVYAADGTTLVTSASGWTGTTPRATWTADTSDSYYIKIMPYNGFTDAGAGSDYTVTVADAAADLVVNEFYGYTTSLTIGGVMTTYTSVANLGFAASTATTIGVYLSTDATIETTDTRIASLALDSVAKGGYGYADASFTLPTSLSAGSYYIGAIVNDDATAAEYDSSNNTLSGSLVTLSAPSCSVDAWEEDDQQAYANPIAVGELQNHDHCEDGSDWLSFDAISGVNYTIDIVGVGSSSDTVLTIYDRDGVTELDSQASSFGDLSYNWTAPATGTYYFLVWSYGANIGGNREYTVAAYDTQADLAVSSVNTIVEDFSGNWIRGGLFEVGVNIVNNGYLASGATDVGIYISSDSVVDTTDTKLATISFADVAAGAGASSYSYNNLVAVPTTLTAGTWYLAGIVDDTNSIAELDETNNTSAISAVTVVDPGCTADSLEPDDFYGQAHALVLGVAQTGLNQCDDSSDWFTFDATAGESYLVRVTTYDFGITTHIIVYDADGVTVLFDSNGSHVDGQRFWTATKSGLHHIRVGQTDSYVGRVSDTGSYDVLIDNCAQDTYEPNNASDSSSTITVGETQNHNFCDGSNDYVSFTATAGTSYTIETAHTGANVDTALTLRNTSGGIEASNSDISGGNTAASITWTAPADGVYTINVYSSFDWGLDSGYTLSVTSP